MSEANPFFSALGDILKIAVKYLWALAIVTGVLLFAPAWFLLRIHLNGFVAKYGDWIGLVFLASMVMAISDLVVKLVRRAARNRAIASSNESTLAELRRLDPKEKAILREFYIQGSNTIQLPIDQATVAGMLHKGILQYAGRLGERSMAGMLFPIKMTAIADGFVHPALIDCPTTEPTEAERRFLIESRPDFLPEIAEHNDLFHGGWRRRFGRWTP